MKPWHQTTELGDFFKVNGEFAMRNLTIFITIVVSSFAIIWLSVTGYLTADIFTAYLLSGGGVYSFGKWQDDKTKRYKLRVKGDKDDADTPES